MDKLTHFDGEGNAVMVDVSGKGDTLREALASGAIRMNREAFEAVTRGTVGKGDVLGAARIAGIMGAKKTAQLIPLCHPVSLSRCTLDFELKPEEGEILARCRAKTEGKTGVEMEALTGVSAALLTIYDMCKALDKNMVMGNIHLEEKTGGKSGPFRFDGEAAGSGQKSLAGQKAPAGQEGSAGEIEDKKERIPLRVAVIVSSDLGYAGKRQDLSGPAIREWVEAAKDRVVSLEIFPDEQDRLAARMAAIADGGEADLILTSGGTGFSPRDVMPEATLQIGERQVPGIAEAMRAGSMNCTPRAMLSRAVSVIRKKTLIINLPGSPKAVRECLELIYPQLEHGIEILTGRTGNCGR